MIKKVTLLLSLGIIYLTHAELPPHQAAKFQQEAEEMQKYFEEYLAASQRKMEVSNKDQKYIASLAAAAKKANEEAQKLSQECNVHENESCKKYRNAEDTNLSLQRQLFKLKFGVDPETIFIANFTIAQMLQMSAMEKEDQK